MVSCRALAAVLVAMHLVGSVGGAQAEVTAKDIQVLSRALGFVQLPASATRIAIVYNPADETSVKSAEAVKGLMGDRLGVGAKSLSVVLMKIGELDDAGEIAVLFLASGMRPEIARVAAASRAKKAPCVTDDLDLVRAGACAIGVRTSPKVEIMVSKAVTAAAGIALDPAFRMLITEV